MIWFILLFLLFTGVESVSLSNKPVLTKKDIEANDDLTFQLGALGEE